MTAKRLRSLCWLTVVLDVNATYVLRRQRRADAAGAIEEAGKTEASLLELRLTMSNCLRRSPDDAHASDAEVWNLLRNCPMTAVAKAAAEVDDNVAHEASSKASLSAAEIDTGAQTRTRSRRRRRNRRLIMDLDESRIVNRHR